jgi:hypothetical protein
MRRIVTDDQRSPAPKSARRFAVAWRRTLACVSSLARATSPRCASFLASARLRTIPTVAGIAYGP